MNPKDRFDFNEILWSFLIKVEGGAKNYKRDHRSPLCAVVLGLSCCII